MPKLEVIGKGKRKRSEILKPVSTKTKQVIEESSVVEEIAPPASVETTTSPALSGEEGYIFVEQTVLGKKADSEPKILKVRPFVTTPARVEVHAKRHFPLGPDAGNLTVAVTISSPCYVEETVDMYKKVDSLVDKIMEIKINKIMKDLNG